MIKLNLQVVDNVSLFGATATELFNSMEEQGLEDTLTPTRKDLQQVLDSDMPISHKLYFVYALGRYDGFEQGKEICG